MRLIDADILLGATDERYKEKKDIVPDNLAEGFFQMEKLIKEQPAAYDLDKVVAELEEFMDEAKQFNASGMVADMIEVVRKGGVE